MLLEHGITWRHPSIVVNYDYLMVQMTLQILLNAQMYFQHDLHSLLGWPLRRHFTETVGLLIVKSAIIVFPLTLGLPFMNVTCSDGSRIQRKYF